MRVTEMVAFWDSAQYGITKGLAIRGVRAQRTVIHNP